MSNLTTISAADLANVTGGKALTSATSSSGDDALLTTLQSIQSSLKDLGKNQNQGLFGGNNGLLFFTMALAMNRRNEVVVYGGNRGYSWRCW